MERCHSLIAAAALAALSGCSSPPPNRGDDGTMLMLAGDVMLGRGVDQILRHSAGPVIYESYMRSARGYVELAEQKSGPIPRRAAPEYVWGDALALLSARKPAARIINLETAVTTADEPWPGKGIHYRMHPANVDVLTAAAIDCAVLANNHVLDWGRDGFEESLEALRKAGVQTAGAGSDLLEAVAPAIVGVPDGRVLIFGLADRSSGVPAAWAALPARSGVHLLPDLSPRTARAVAEKVRSHPRLPGDRVVVSVHWGGNWGYDVPAAQVRFARLLIDKGGVDVVHGHSSHHPKRIEIYRERLILYGAGDLINDYEGIGGYEEYRPNLSLLYLPRLAPSGVLESMILAPMRMERFRLNRATADEARWLRERMARESRGAVLELTGDGLILLRPK